MVGRSKSFNTFIDKFLWRKSNHQKPSSVTLAEPSIPDDVLVKIFTLKPSQSSISTTSEQDLVEIPACTKDEEVEREPRTIVLYKSKTFPERSESFSDVEALFCSKQLALRFQDKDPTPLAPDNTITLKEMLTLNRIIPGKTKNQDVSNLARQIDSFCTKLVQTQETFESTHSILQFKFLNRSGNQLTSIEAWKWILVALISNMNKMSSSEKNRVRTKLDVIVTSIGTMHFNCKQLRNKLQRFEALEKQKMENALPQLFQTSVLRALKIQPKVFKVGPPKSMFSKRNSIEEKYNSNDDIKSSEIGTTGTLSDPEGECGAVQLLELYSPGKVVLHTAKYSQIHEQVDFEQLSFQDKIQILETIVNDLQTTARNAMELLHRNQLLCKNDDEFLSSIEELIQNMLDSHLKTRLYVVQALFANYIKLIHPKLVQIISVCATTEKVLLGLKKMMNWIRNNIERISKGKYKKRLERVLKQVEHFTYPL